LSEEEDLEEIRRRKLEQIKQQAMQQQIADQQRKSYEDQKYQIMRIILSSEARQRLENIRMVKAEFAEQIELQLIQLYRAGRLRGKTPLPDEAFKNLLEQIAQSNKKKDFNIKRF